jgi:hypothetical protein
MNTPAPLLTLDFPSSIQRIIDLARKRPGMFPAPRRLEFRLCALLTAWESLALANAHAQHWFDLWRKHCRQVHGEKSNLTLADALRTRTRDGQGTTLSRQQVSHAYDSVLRGLKSVYKRTRSVCQTEAQDARILADVIARSFDQAKEFADPEGLEIYLLTLIELFEIAAREGKPVLISRTQWRQAIERKRSLGPAATRTLADVVPFEARVREHPRGEGAAALCHVTKHIESIMHELGAYLRREHARLMA